MPESLRLYVICKSMKWAHLPVAGGLYDQSPKMLDDFMTIMIAESQAEKRRHDKMMREQKKGQGGGRVAPRRRR